MAFKTISKPMRKWMDIYEEGRIPCGLAGEGCKWAGVVEQVGRDSNMIGQAVMWLSRDINCQKSLL